mmetsp:Transcript_28925/g.77812  ORF Transcript_28925/g.77812 Transcript_28925/m.77812 type:complete len:220 (-) Transcript_28925:642-1301(-)
MTQRATRTATLRRPASSIDRIVAGSTPRESAGVDSRTYAPCKSEQAPSLARSFLVYVTRQQRIGPQPCQSRQPQRDTPVTLHGTRRRTRTSTSAGQRRVPVFASSHELGPSSLLPPQPSKQHAVMWLKGGLRSLASSDSINTSSQPRGTTPACTCTVHRNRVAAAHPAAAAHPSKHSRPRVRSVRCKMPCATYPVILRPARARHLRLRPQTWRTCRSSA